jgi:hypothetical protein
VDPYLIFSTKQNVVNANYELNTTQEDSLLLTAGQIHLQFEKSANENSRAKNSASNKKARPLISSRAYREIKIPYSIRFLPE